MEAAWVIKSLPSFYALSSRNMLGRNQTERFCQESTFSWLQRFQWGLNLSSMFTIKKVEEIRNFGKALKSFSLPALTWRSFYFEISGCFLSESHCIFGWEFQRISCIWLQLWYPYSPFTASIFNSGILCSGLFPVLNLKPDYSSIWFTWCVEVQIENICVCTFRENIWCTWDLNGKITINEIRMSPPEIMLGHKKGIVCFSKLRKDTHIWLSFATIFMHLSGHFPQEHNFRDRVQILLLMLSEFHRINGILCPSIIPLLIGFSVNFASNTKRIN